MTYPSRTPVFFSLAMALGSSYWTGAPPGALPPDGCPDAGGVAGAGAPLLLGGLVDGADWLGGAFPSFMAFSASCLALLSAFESWGFFSNCIDSILAFLSALDSSCQANSSHVHAQFIYGGKPNMCHFNMHWVKKPTSKDIGHRSCMLTSESLDHIES